MLIPNYNITIDGEDVTNKFKNILTNLNITQTIEANTDNLKFTLVEDQKQGKINLPQTGAKVTLKLGTNKNLFEMGVFTVDQITASGYPRKLIINCKSADQTEKKTPAQTQKTRNFEEGKTLQDIAQTIAGENNLQLEIDPELASVALPYLTQNAESDFSFISRLFGKYGGVAKPTHDKLIAVKKGNKTISGATLEPLKLTNKNLVSYNITFGNKQSFNKVVAWYRDPEEAKDKQAIIGDGLPVFIINELFFSEAEATAAATSKLKDSQQGKGTGTINIINGVGVVVGSEIANETEQEELGKKLFIVSATHNLASKEFKTTLKVKSLF